ncbi:MAG: xanthine dehydrogenase family protein molybdopterin-binding subunit [Alphaproteobacteria bacterium]|nr:xanthine dehydrogenase family protein molybdopterin-binding subunit [Alphaproteobacteria bacterium]
MNAMVPGRRQFLLATLSAAGGLAVGVGFAPDAAALPTNTEIWDTPPPAGAHEVTAWVVIEPDESVLIRVAKQEMGQGILTALPMLVAEELGCDWTKVRAEYASAHRNLVEKNVYGRMGTGGSRSVRENYRLLQQAGASARERLVAAAAARWGVAPAACSVRDGRITHPPSGRTLGFGAVAADAARITLTAEPAIRPPEQFRLAGTPQPRLDTPVKVNGSARFGIDTRLPGMLYAAVAACPVFGGTLVSADDKAIAGRRGIKAVVRLKDAVVVVADNFWRAKQALADLPVTWDEGAAADTDSAQFRAAYRAALDGPAANALTRGNAAAALAGAPKTVEALYEVPYLAHATMEPLNCTAHVQPGRVDVWLGTQFPEKALEAAAEVAGVAPGNVYVHNCYLGGGFGRRAVNDELRQAVAVSKAVGAPVKLIWTREEDIRHDRYRPQAAIRFRAGLGADGMPVAWQARTAVGSIRRSLGWDPVTNGVESSAVEGLANTPYAFPNATVDCILKNTHVPVMFWRSVGSSQNAFAVESFIDELAAAAGVDPLTMRRRLLAGKSDFLHVLDVLEENSGWGRPLPAGWGRGIAIHQSFDTIVGEVVEASVSSRGEVRVHRVVAAVDCGHVVNPATVERQIESAVIYGLTAALSGEITIAKGRVEQGNFDTYEMVRMADAPRIETHLALSGGGKWGGIGEPGTPPIAPALANAIFDATGTRVRSLPLKHARLVGRA